MKIYVIQNPGQRPSVGEGGGVKIYTYKYRADCTPINPSVMHACQVKIINRRGPKILSTCSGRRVFAIVFRHSETASR